MEIEFLYCCYEFNSFQKNIGRICILAQLKGECLRVLENGTFFWGRADLCSRRK
jgi:hypothetical protein